MSIVYPLVPIIGILVIMGFMTRHHNRNFEAINKVFDAQSKRMGLLAERIAALEGKAPGSIPFQKKS